ncbi:MAG: hypothetical protein KTR25_17480 [Myxococcales bacterium]|nr:hypothetical protein [Myxococcales bacterium]
MVDLRAFQTSIEGTFGPKDRERGIPGTFMYLIEEIGELAEALKEPEQHDVAGEFADCLAWLVSLANLANIDLAEAATRKYPKKCIRCDASPCTCLSKP